MAGAGPVYVHEAKSKIYVPLVVILYRFYSHLRATSEQPFHQESTVLLDPNSGNDSMFNVEHARIR